MGKVLRQQDRFDHLCELNVIEQVVNVCQTSMVQDAWIRNQSLTVHGWIYGLKDGLVRDLGISVQNPSEIQNRYKTVVDDYHQAL